MEAKDHEPTIEQVFIAAEGDVSRWLAFWGKDDRDDRFG